MVSLEPVTPAVVRRQVVLEELDVAADGRTAVVVRRSVEGNRYRRALWLVPLDDGRPRQLTSGLPADTHPRFSPDGRHVAFLSSRTGGTSPGSTGTARAGGAVRPAAAPEPPADVWVVPARGGTVRRVTRSRHGVRGFAWSPEGTRIACWGPEDPPRFLEGERPDGSVARVRRITRADWRLDDEGFLDRHVHLSVAGIRPGSRPRRLTRGDFDVIAPAWDADGESLVFCAAVGDRADLHPRPRVFRVAAPASAVAPRGTPASAAAGPEHPTDGPGAPDPQSQPEPVEVTRLRGLVEAAVPSSDGRWLALLGADVDDAPDDVVPALFVAPADGSRPPEPLAAGLDLPVGAHVDTDLNGWASSPRVGPWWRPAPDGSIDLVALVTRRGRSLPWRFPVDRATGRSAGEPAPLADAESACWALAVGGDAVAVLGTLGRRAMELMTVRDGGFRTVTTFGSAWQRRLQSPAMEDLLVAGPGGPVETWLASPPDAGSRPLPLVVDIHGGPLGGWAPAPSLEVQILVSAGYRVALPNIRGSAGYGAAWVRPLMDGWGGPDAEDVLAVVDRLVGEGLADADRLGLLGLSYGGFLVNWLVGAAPGRFAAAVSEAGVTNQIAAWALSDTGPDYNLRAALGDPLTADGVERLWRQSPLRLVASVRTPLLLLQGETDHRCPAADNEQFFVALRELGRTVEYALYPESGHVYANTGRPDRRIDRHARMLEWFRRHLG